MVLNDNDTNDVKETKSVVKKVTAKSYLEVFNDNYYGRSEQAKELQEQLKKRDTGKTKVSYIPWATMIRMATQQDPDFTWVKELSPEGTFLFYHGRKDLNVLPKDKDGIPIDDSAYFVQVTATFMGKTMREEYPVQDFNFESVSFSGRKFISSSAKTIEIKMDSNIVNKALQRATAKVISELTGIGLSLYETGDLQFEDETDTGKDKTTNTTTPTPTTEKPKTTKGATVVTQPAKVDVNTGEVKAEAGIEMATPEQVAIITELNKDEKIALRIAVALKSYKAATFADFTKAEATIIINALNKPKVAV